MTGSNNTRRNGCLQKKQNSKFLCKCFILLLTLTLTAVPLRVIAQDDAEAQANEIEAIISAEEQAEQDPQENEEKQAAESPDLDSSDIQSAEKQEDLPETEDEPEGEIILQTDPADPEPEDIPDAAEPEDVSDAAEPEAVPDAAEPEAVPDAAEPEDVPDTAEPEKLRLNTGSEEAPEDPLSYEETGPIPLTSIKKVTLKKSTYVYNGKARIIDDAVAVTAVVDGVKVTLVHGQDYTTSYQNNQNVGTATVTVTGIGAYTGTVSRTFQITPRQIRQVRLKHSSLRYTGKKRTQSGTTIVRAWIGGWVTLTKGEDYSIHYKNNLNAGTATMIVTGKGNYTGTIEKTFRITPVSLKSAALKYTSKLYTGSALKPAATVKASVNKKLVTLKKGTDYTVFYKNNTNPGTATVTIRGKGNFTGTFTKQFTIKPMKITGNGSTRTITVAPRSETGNVRVAVWSSIADQDDLVWYTMKKNSSGNYVCKIRLDNLVHPGQCNLHVYDGNNYFAGRDYYPDRADWMAARSEQFRSRWLTGSDSSIDYVQTALNIAKDNSIGYGHEWPDSISCAGLVGLSLTHCGYGDFIRNDSRAWGYSALGPEFEAEMSRIGAVWHPGLSGLQEGDILYWYDHTVDALNTSCHIGIYIGNRKTVEARADKDGRKGDRSGLEVTVCTDWNKLPWQGYWRLSSIHWRF